MGSRKHRSLLTADCLCCAFLLQTVFGVLSHCRLCAFLCTGSLSAAHSLQCSTEHRAQSTESIQCTLHTSPNGNWTLPAANQLARAQLAQLAQLLPMLHFQTICCAPQRLAQGQEVGATCCTSQVSATADCMQTLFFLVSSGNISLLLSSKKIFCSFAAHLLALNLPLPQAQMRPTVNQRAADSPSGGQKSRPPKFARRKWAPSAVFALLGGQLGLCAAARGHLPAFRARVAFTLRPLSSQF